MTVKELVETNAFIGDITIDIRGRHEELNPLRDEKYAETFSWLKQDWHIGAHEGKTPPHPSKKGTYLEEKINSKDNGAEYYEILISKIPAELLRLHVVNWRVWKSYRGIVSSENSLEHLLITAWTDETKAEAEQQAELKALDRAQKRELRKKETEKADDNLVGQMSIEDILQ